MSMRDRLMQDVLSAFSWVCLTPHEKADFFAQRCCCEDKFKKALGDESK